MRLMLLEIMPANDHRFGLHPKGIHKQTDNQIIETGHNGRTMNILVYHLFFFFLQGFGYYSFFVLENNK